MSDSPPSEKAPFPHCVTVRSNGRLHFGLTEIAEGEPNCYGGIGLMVEHSKATVRAIIAGPETCATVVSDCVIESNDYWRPRVESLLAHWQRNWGSLPVHSISIEQEPSPHCGLGSGTQIACTISATLIAAEIVCLRSQRSKPMPPSGWNILSLLENSNQGELVRGVNSAREKLARISQRGKRSNIGLHGFLEGGFIYDSGQSEMNSEPSAIERTRRFSFPSDWRILTIHNESVCGDSGIAESTMFEQCSQHRNPNRLAMIGLIEERILPSIENQDWDSFSSALGLYGRMAGEIFSAVQGGVYRTSQIARTIHAVRALGLESATQSSWGPTVCAVARDPSHADWCLKRIQEQFPSSAVQVVQAANHSAQVELQ
jgi:beta-ribofuranosylaminobenzene 5'-phosphate synthase